MPAPKWHYQNYNFSLSCLREKAKLGSLCIIVGCIQYVLESPTVGVHKQGGFLKKDIREVLSTSRSPAGSQGPGTSVSPRIQSGSGSQHPPGSGTATWPVQSHTASPNSRCPAKCWRAVGQRHRGQYFNWFDHPKVTPRDMNWYRSCCSNKIQTNSKVSR